jgi:glycerophosphoryl diester phosphodiesterase
MMCGLHNLMTDPNQCYRESDPVFNLPRPLLFAHRGGAREVAESTAMGFRYALEEARADVLELDVQLTRDGEFVVWHGPDLDNVKIADQPDRPIRRERRMIHDYRWREIERAWVADPELNDVPVAQRDLSAVPCSEERRILPLSEFLEMFPSVPLNIEMKKTFQDPTGREGRGVRKNVEAFTRVLESGLHGRTIVVASSSDRCLQTFRALNGSRYPTCLSVREQLLLPFVRMDMRNRCLETSHHWVASRKGVVRRVRGLGGSTFVFLSAFTVLLPAIDWEDVREQEIVRILERGVDGIMTDRPKRVRPIIDRWKKAQQVF